MKMTDDMLKLITCMLTLKINFKKNYGAGEITKKRKKRTHDVVQW